MCANDFQPIPGFTEVTKNEELVQKNTQIGGVVGHANFVYYDTIPHYGYEPQYLTTGNVTK